MLSRKNNLKIGPVLIILLISVASLVICQSSNTTTEFRKFSSLDKNSTGIVLSENASMLFSSQDMMGEGVKAPSVMKKKKKKKSPPPPCGCENDYHHHHNDGASRHAYGDHAFLCMLLAFLSCLFSFQNGGIWF
ncbi:hypothetical protein SUGI_0303400 [Cryptomeria japonica]|nr:hypothetical protein SUGI_0303400 [Cryptomeria japonica]